MRRARRPVAPVLDAPLLEGPFQRALEVRLCAPTGQTRMQRINSGRALIRGKGGSTRLFRGAKAGTGQLVRYVIGEGRHNQLE